MATAVADILVEIPDEDLIKLGEMYKPHNERAPEVYSVIMTGIEWRQKGDDRMKFFSPNNCWREDGTFFVLLQYYKSDLFIFTLDDSGKNAYEAMLSTQRFNKLSLEKSLQLFSIHVKLHSLLLKAIEKRNWHIDLETPCYMYSIAKEKAMEFNIECPPDVYIKKLDASHAAIVNAEWPHKEDGTAERVNVLLTMNGGYGVFLKSNDELVCWILLTMLGQLGLLQTKNGHQKKGYASLVTKYLSKVLAEKGHNPFGTILLNNIASIKMFEKLGFSNLGISVYTAVSLCNKL